MKEKQAMKKLTARFHIIAEVMVEPHTNRPVCVFYNLIKDKEKP
jgi:hypothetical protein